jgi:hypothetical protein
LIELSVFVLINLSHVQTTQGGKEKMVLITQFTRQINLSFHQLMGVALSICLGCSALGEGNGARQEETQTRNSLSAFFTPRALA